MSENKTIQSVVTTLNVIEIMAEARAPLGVSELARKIGITKPRIFRHLRTLLDQGYVDQAVSYTHLTLPTNREV